MHLYQLKIIIIFNLRNKFIGKLYALAQSRQEAIKLAYICFKRHGKVKISFEKEINMDTSQILEGLVIPFITKSII